MKIAFTIVELLIVVVVIATLTSISLVAYNGVTQKARFAAMRSDITTLNKAILQYYSIHGSYPVTPPGVPGTACASDSGFGFSWCGFDQAVDNDFIPAITPSIISRTPQLPTSNGRNDTYLYMSNGSDYKLIRYDGNELSAQERSEFSSLMTTGCIPAHINVSRWGYWSGDASRCW